MNLQAYTAGLEALKEVYSAWGFRGLGCRSQGLRPRPTRFPGSQMRLGTEAKRSATFKVQSSRLYKVSRFESVGECTVKQRDRLPIFKQGEEATRAH